MTRIETNIASMEDPWDTASRPPHSAANVRAASEQRNSNQGVWSLLGRSGATAQADGAAPAAYRSGDRGASFRQPRTRDSIELTHLPPAEVSIDIGSLTDKTPKHPAKVPVLPYIVSHTILRHLCVSSDPRHMTEQQLRETVAVLGALSGKSKFLYGMADARDTLALYRKASNSHDDVAVADVLAGLSSKLVLDKKHLLTTLIDKSIPHAIPGADEALRVLGDQGAAARIELALMERSRSIKRLMAATAALMAGIYGTSRLSKERGTAEAAMSTDPNPGDPVVLGLLMGLVASATILLGIPWLLYLLRTADAHNLASKARRQTDLLDLLDRKQLAADGEYRDLLDRHKIDLIKMVAPHIRELEPQDQGAPLGALCRTNVAQPMKADLLHELVLPQLSELPMDVCVKDVLPHLLKHPELPPSVVRQSFQLLQASQTTCADTHEYAQAWAALIPHLAAAGSADDLMDLVNEDGPLQDIPEQYLPTVLASLAITAFSSDVPNAREDFNARVRTLAQTVDENNPLHALVPPGATLPIDRDTMTSRLLRASANRALSATAFSSIVYIASIAYRSSANDIVDFLIRATQIMTPREPDVLVGAARDVVGAMRETRTFRNNKVLEQLVHTLGDKRLSLDSVEQLVDLLAQEIGSPETFDPRRLSRDMEAALSRLLRPFSLLMRLSSRRLPPGGEAYQQTVRIAETLARLVELHPRKIRDPIPAMQHLSVFDEVPLSKPWAQFRQQAAENTSDTNRTHVTNAASASRRPGP